MAAEKCVICLTGAMDRLWFHQFILFSEPSLFHLVEDPREPLLPPESPDYSSDNSSQVSAISEKELSQDDENSSQESCTTHVERPTSLTTLVSGKTRSRASSPISAQNKFGRFQKTMSCKSLVELELEEVKGFIDLGFIFRKENTSKRMMNLIPGLQRIDSFTSNNDDDEDDDKGVMRPYLSEAWIIKKPDSPLLNLRIPKVYTNADMKRHLRYWAKKVASTIQQES